MYRALVATILLLAGAAMAAVEVDVTACDQEVPRGAVGTLQADLVCPTQDHCEGNPLDLCTTNADCPGMAPCEKPYAVELGTGATLRLNGHSITGGAYGVLCETRCSVEGPGDISGASFSAVITYLGQYRLTLSNLSIHDNSSGIVQAGTVKLTDVDISNNQLRAIGRARVVKGTNVTANGNGLQAILADRVRLQSLTATGNGDVGVIGSTGVALENSTVTGNQAGGDGVDILSGRRPRLVNTTCGRSGNMDDGAPWGVCTLDPP
jgi:hypothetical protein